MQSLLLRGNSLLGSLLLKLLMILPTLGKIFMKQVPGAILEITPGVQDVAPVGYLEEAWFRVQGIPMKYRTKKTIFRICAMAGKPIALDTNTVRNFAYVRVKLGCIHVGLAPATRVREIGGAFYEFQYTREVLGVAKTNPNTTGIQADNQDKEE